MKTRLIAVITATALAVTAAAPAKANGDLALQLALNALDAGWVSRTTDAGAVPGVLYPKGGVFPSGGFSQLTRETSFPIVVCSYRTGWRAMPCTPLSARGGSRSASPPAT